LNDYEIMLLLDPELTEEQGNAIIQRIRDSVDGAQGSWDGHEPWGRRRLAYEIGHKGEAVYHLLLFSAPAEALDEITRVLKITDGVMRHGAYRRVKGSQHQKAPSQAPLAPVSAEEPEAMPAEVVAVQADDTDEATE
jgi:small subunit ribosomal protein S6